MTDRELQLSGLAVLTFNRGILERLEELCGLQEKEWIADRHHPYIDLTTGWDPER